MFDQAEMLGYLGDSYTNKIVERLNRFAFIPNELLDSLATDALTQNWGANNFVLKKYLAAHVAWSIEQGRFTVGGDQFYVTAGHLQTRYGTPLYLAFSKNRNTGREPYYLVAAGSKISAPQLPIPPDIPPSPVLPDRAEIVMMHDHILGDNASRFPWLNQTPRVAQMCAISGAIQWSINRGLHLSQWYFGSMTYVVPLYLQSREDITAAPDLIAPVQVNPDSLLVRTVLLPHMAYGNSRVAVKRHDQLPHWLIAAWDEHADLMTEAEIENPETA
ncbi:hypothetical protein ASE80_26350 [Pseudomonas sp. Leaf15]|uniref:DUF3825 domain-containing protein n=1 Tax=Pseudomonas TaxID=286 RepID=UPI0007035BCA|nr:MULTISPECIES: DUF3825 domain-containing protein [Pseudomonas]KQM52181.1 hypothetical protein ASE80_26350 [Pseudomonas sp. Leaf15]RAH04253.1 DUF3825 domain-containing protein [Pseudomonas sp. Leaf98]